ncbi:uncharacterized protein PG998_006429 [Apiospora kogelbergensis]|uniref:uncharacterized protein n=1 Tax=Apiospora kogelbergensis TaxID=1337665 RepID=UPI00312F2862
MSLSTTCKLFWADVHGHVVSATNETALCDGTYTQCQMTPKSGGRGQQPPQQLRATCDSRPHDAALFPSSSVEYYFCVCHGRDVLVPPGVTCTSSCYAMTRTRFPDCELVTLLYDDHRRLGRSNSNSPMPLYYHYTASCTAFDCDTTGVNCTDPTNDQGGLLFYTCDNHEHHPQTDADAPHSYVCNCRGAATVPAVYTSSGKDVQGQGCGAGNGSGGIKVGGAPAGVAAKTRSAAPGDGDRATPPNSALPSPSTSKTTLLAHPTCTAIRHARQLDDPTQHLLVVDWADGDSSTSPQARQQQNTATQTYLAAAPPCASPALYHVSLTSASGETRALLDAPVTEVVRLYFAADLSDQTQGQILTRVHACACTCFLPHAAGHVGEPRFGFALDLAELPETEGADKKKQGMGREKGRVLFALAGWESRAAWTAWAGSEAAREGIAAMKGLPGLKGQELFLVGRGESVG